ncbi:MAG: hypothetical protein IT370_09825 [Deltaproteobacteria bacterium]|nr:hypothetical protein [Deltaproteobacteria bacterium]
MRRVMVRYRLLPERVAEHQALLAALFAELARARPAGLEYRVLALADGVSFVHLATTSGADNPLLALAAFKAFSADIKARCADGPPVATEITLVGDYPGGAALGAG